MAQSLEWRTLSRWLGFVAAIWVQSISGNNYTFGNYSADLKDVLNYTQVELNTLGNAKDVGKSLGVLAGYLADFLPTSVILMIGAIVGVLGYGSTWLVISERIAPPALWQMCVIVFLGGNSTTWMNTAVLVTCMRNFSWSRGAVSGILKGFVGLSTAIFTVLCASLFTGGSSAFLLLLTLLPAAICVIAAIFLREVPSDSGAAADDDAGGQTNFSVVYVISLVLSAYLLLYTFLQEGLSPTASKIFGYGLLAILVSPVVIPGRIVTLKWLSSRGGPDQRKVSTKKTEESSAPLLTDRHSEASRDKEAGEPVEDSGERAGPAEGTESARNEEGGLSRAASKYSRPQLGDNFSLHDILMSYDFWILFLTFLCAIGTGMAVVNNLGQIGEALGHPDASMFVSFFSIFGFFGRICAGAVSERFVRSAAVPRPAWMAGSKVAMILGYIVLAWGIPWSLQFGSIIVGMSYGVHMTIVVATSSEMFGLKSFGILYNLLILNIPLGSFLFSGYLAGYLYDKEAIKDGGDGIPRIQYSTKSMNMNLWSNFQSENHCYGAHCFRTLFMIMTFVLAVGLVLDLILVLRLRPLYQKLHRARRQLSRSRQRGTETDSR